MRTSTGPNNTVARAASGTVTVIGNVVIQTSGGLLGALLEISSS